ncbi:MAG: hypothetical protein M1837_007037 [Sclerophora amabilis]|nr:MAG: hypothetical protein M1837_007037 [Sclerophora amabilis]
MARPKRKLIATADETSTPPTDLSENQAICRVIRAAGNNLYLAELPSGDSILAELPARFRSTIWIKRGGYLLVNTTAFDVRDNKLQGEIDNVVRDEKEWRKQAYWQATRSPPDCWKSGKLLIADVSKARTVSKAIYIDGKRFGRIRGWKDATSCRF